MLVYTPSWKDPRVHAKLYKRSTNYSVEGITSLIEMQLPQGEGKELFNSVQKYFNTLGEKMNNTIIIWAERECLGK